MDKNIQSLKWNKDKKSMNVSKGFLKDLKQLARLLSSQYLQDKSRCGKLALDVYNKSLQKGENRRLTYSFLKQNGVWQKFQSLIRTESGNQWIVPPKKL